MKKLLAVLMVVALAMAVSGCAPTLSTPKVPFDAAAARDAIGSGNNTIRGTAMMWRSAGAPATCAGLEIALIPVTEASTDIMKRIFKSTNSGYYREISGATRLNLTPVADILSINRKDTCDPLGGFSFEGVKDGSYYLLTQIKWKENSIWDITSLYPDYNKGGYLMQRVDVARGQTVEVEIVPESTKGNLP